jgi:hypothetical protein
MPGKAHKPDKQSRDLVSALALNGVAQVRIAMHVGVSPVTLRKFYRDTLDLATESVCACVAKNLVRIASTGSGNATVQAAKYVLGCKAHWKDTTHVEIERTGGEEWGVDQANARELILAKLAAMNVRRPEPDSSEGDSGPQERGMKPAV